MTGVPLPEPAKADDLRLDGASVDVAGERRRALFDLFPEARTDAGSIDFDQLRRALGDAVDPGKERFGLTWSGKAACFKAIQTPSMATLLPLPEKSADFEATGNVIIEGDNLEVLKLLQKSYLGKIKMIYIDPPYNTGNDFIYPDNYSESLQTYLRYTGQIDNDGRRFSNNPDTDGRFHTKWLNMMYPRLYLARNLLRDDGVIFISIDDGEFYKLRSICDEIFGEDAFIATFVWKSRQNKDNRTKNGASVDHEYIVCYGRTIRGAGRDTSLYSNPDGDPRGDWASANMAGLATADRRPNLHFILTDPATGVKYECPAMGWRYDPTTMTRLISENRIIWPKSADGRPRRKVFLAELSSDATGFSTIVGSDIYTRDGTSDIDALFQSRAFEFPKPVALLEEIIQQGSSNDSLILDFFAGSGTTGQSVFDLNARDGGRRRFILVQLPEPTGRADYPTIVDLLEERIRRAASKLSDANSDKLPVDGSVQDCGFRVFKLSESNVREWDIAAPHEVESLQAQLALGVDHLRSDRTELDIVYEVLLKSGYTLSETVTAETVVGHAVYSVGDGVYLICLEQALTLDLIRAVADRKPERVLFLDGGFAGNDQLKTNAAQTFKDKNIVFRTL